MSAQVFVLVALLFAVVVNCQQYDQHQYDTKRPLPAILSHKQSLGNDGSFQYSFSADNGLQQGETISPDGSRKGSYSYVDPNGKTITVTYTADKNGFHVQGDHIPKPVQPVAPAAPHPQYHAAPAAAPQYQPAVPQYHAAPKQYERQQFGFGPAVFPASRHTASYSTPSYSPAASTYTPQHDNVDYDDKVDSNKPHSFGEGYSFQFEG